MQKQQTILAALSLGPVGIADQLSERPTAQGSRTPNPNARITSNKPLVMGTCAATGDLLQPSYPLTPLDRMLTSYVNGNYPPFALWGTYTSVPSGTGVARNIWYTAYCFGGGKPDKEQTCSLSESDLAPMVDGDALPDGDFSAIPTGSFGGAGSTFANSSGVTGHVLWTSDWEAQSQEMHPSIYSAEQAPTGCGSVVPKAWASDGGVNAEMALSDTIINVAPVFGDVALLGEAGKIAAVSTYRFRSVSGTAAGITADLRGKGGEAVTLLVATRSGSGFACSAKTVAIGADGTATAKIAS